MTEPGTRVWDLPVRLVHWALAVSCAAGWVTTAYLTGWHEAAGYAALALVVFRVFWGFAGGRYARFSQFMRGPRATLSYARLVWQGHAPRYLGHNPLGAWMAMALWSCVAALGVTGWLYTTDMFFGEPWLNLTHELLAWALFPLVALHVAGVVHTVSQKSDRLITAMFTGDKRPPSGGDVS